MKPITTILLFMLIHFYGFSQNLPDVGSRWYYDELYLFETLHKSTIITIDYDSTFNNNRWLHLDFSERPTFLFKQNTPMIEWVRYEPEKMYYWFDGEEVLLYDFSLEVGDTIEYKVPYELSPDCYDSKWSYVIQVVSYKGMKEIDGKPFSEMILYEDFENEGFCRTDFRYLVNGIGPTLGYFFPTNGLWEGMPNLLCYHSPEDEVTYIDNATNCIITGTENIIQKDLKLYPNPACTYIQIGDLSKNKIHMVEIMDWNGHLVLKQDNNTGKIDISELSSGVYFLKLSGDDTSLVSRFVVVK